MYFIWTDFHGNRGFTKKNISENTMTEFGDTCASNVRVLYREIRIISPCSACSI